MLEIIISQQTFNERKNKPIIYQFSKIEEKIAINQLVTINYGKITKIDSSFTCTIIDLEATFDLKETMHKSDYVFSGNLLTIKKDTISLPNGKGAYREVIEHPGASAILVINENNEIYLERQYRYPINDVVLEIPAGKLNHNEDPLNAAKRELAEETGLIANNIKKIGEIYPAIGYSDEIIHIYLVTSFTKGNLNLDEDEFVDVILVPLELVIEWIKEGKIKDSKTISSIYYYLLTKNFK